VYGDYSRVLDGLPGQYSAVLAQQGRLVMDADLNYQTSIVLDYLRTLATDLIGPFAGPFRDAGFAVEPVVEDGKCRAVRLGSGHYYVYGLRCESPLPHRSPSEQFAIGDHEAPFVVSLLVWEQGISAIQAPEIADPALSPEASETTRRSQVRWLPCAIRRLPGTEGEVVDLSREDIISAFHASNADQHRRPTLGARAHPVAEVGPGSAPTARGYRGVENQLYRVEVHRGGDAGEATFKWSRDNGSVEFAVRALSAPDGEGMRTASLGGAWTDARRGLEIGDWVELVDDRWAPEGKPPPLMQVMSVSIAKRQVTLHDADAGRVFDASLHPLLRRWDQAPDGDAPNHGIPLRHSQGQWHELEDGVQVQFEGREAREAHESGVAHYERGDFWLIPARTTTGGVLWPQSSGDQDGPLALPPHGPVRYLAPLALIRDLPGELTDLRISFTNGMDELAGAEQTLSADFATEVAPRVEPAVIASPAISYRVRATATVARGKTFQLYDGAVIGRAADAGIQLDHHDVSRHHAQFSVRDGTLTITDLGSTNGTAVNDVRLAVHSPTELFVGDAIQLGTAEVQLTVEEGS
jgi:Family of unknown function (DUF6519)/FHA domain